MNDRHAKRYTQQQVDQLLQQAKLFGVDLPHNSLHGPILCRKLKLAGHDSDQRDAELLERIVERAEKASDNNRFNYIIPFRATAPHADDHLEQGDIQPFRTVESGLSVGTFFSELAQTTGVAGRAGGGKSTLSFRLIDGAASKGLSCFVIDSKGDLGGGQFRALSYLYPGRVLFAKVGRTVFHNPWRRLQNLVQYFLHIYERHDAVSVLHQVFQLFKNRSVVTGAIAPTLEDIITMVGEVHSPAGLPAINPALKKSLLAVLFQVRAALGISTACQRGWDLAEIMRRGLIVIVDTSEIAGTNHEEFLICSLLSEIREIVRSDATIKSQNNAKVLFYIDESTTIVGRRNDVGRQLSPMAHLATLVRSSEVILILGFHSPRNVSDIIRSTMSVFLCTGITNGGDVLAVRDAAFLSSAQAEALTHLPVGTAMMKMASRFTHPFLIGCNPIPDFPHLSQADIDANNAAILRSLPPVVPADHRRNPPVAVTSQPDDGPPQLDKTDEWFCILADLEKRPFLSITKRASSLTIPSGKTGYKLIKAALEDLKAQGFCADLAVQAQSGRPEKFWLLTESGHRAIGSRITPQRGGTDYEHYWAQRLLRELLAQRGIPADIEAKADRSSPPVDVGFADPETGLRIAVEVCCSTFAQEPEKATRILGASWDYLLVVTLLKHDLTRLEREFVRAPATDSRVTLCLPYHLAEALSLRPLYECPNLVYKPDWKPAKGGQT